MTAGSTSRPEPAEGRALRPAAEERWADELAALAAADAKSGAEIPRGWRLSPRSVRTFIVGDEDLGITRKFYGDDPLIDRAIVTLLGRQGLMLVGEPGTAKSMLSELLAAAICGTSTLTIQGSAGTTEDHVRYSWNYALLIAEGPSRRALVPSPVYQAMEQGAVVRFEEITRCPPEIQDTLVSVLSEKQLMVPELEDGFRVSAAQGFNIIATANLRDRGVHEMSSALKRRFNFETVRPIADRAFEAELIASALDTELGEQRVPMNPKVLDVLVTVFADLRTGTTATGTPVKRPETVMSTAEAVNVGVAASLSARYLGDGAVRASDIARQLVGVALKGQDEDAKRMRFYIDSVVRERAASSTDWKDFLTASQGLWE
ncbi:AAA family ATPase [Actinomyces johnsonii]|uniref:AAA family ATPase n=1 Tax=Actinomyces johnsonii TaxID=544581 RepID=A0A508A849_9ACTO|nr:AAA family ATPase [Actinomyces johnsonii]KAA8743581.1 AAA family ATPase [Actinomyces johnsonii]TQD44058.1 AAA family ATPase [Actinomyces johnsonii]